MSYPDFMKKKNCQKKLHVRSFSENVNFHCLKGIKFWFFYSGLVVAFLCPCLLIPWKGFFLLLGPCRNCGLFIDFAHDVDCKSEYFKQGRFSRCIGQDRSVYFEAINEDKYKALITQSNAKS